MKVKFLQVCVCPQGACLVQGGLLPVGAWSGGSAPREVAWSRGGSRGGCLVQGGCVDPPPTAAGGTHPTTGMHSCIFKSFVDLFFLI